MRTSAVASFFFFFFIFFFFLVVRSAATDAVTVYVDTCAGWLKVAADGAVVQQGSVV